MSETPTPRPARPIDPFAIVALVLGVVSILRFEASYYPGLLIGIVAGLLAILFGIGGIARRGGRWLMPILAALGALLGFTGGGMALVGILRLLGGG